jgi:hypothetical protein
MSIRIRRDAAKYLSERSGFRFTEESLAARASSGTGPRYAILNGRAVYSDEALDEWLEAQLRAESASAKGRRRIGHAA